MSADNNKLTLAISGYEHRDWERYSIDSDFFTPADGWSLSLGIPATAIPDYVKPWAEVQVRLGTDVILTGRVDAVRRRLAKGTHTLELHGRDRAGILLDCSAPILARRELTLEEICTTYLRPLGIDRIEVQGKDTRKKVTVEPGMSAWEALERAAELAGLWPWFTADGVLKVAAPDYSRAVDAELILEAEDGKKNNVIELSLEDNCQRRYSEVTLLGQGTGDERKGANPSIRAVARDEDAGFSRPLIRDGAHLETTAQAQAKANKLLSDSIFESWQATARVRGHRTDNGTVWEPGMHIRLISKPLALDVDTMLARRTLMCDRQGGTTTMLYLRPWALWLPDTAQGAKHKHKKKGGDCCNCDLCAG